MIEVKDVLPNDHSSNLVTVSFFGDIILYLSHIPNVPN